MAKFCSNCGEQLDDGAKFCGKCGQKIHGEQISDRLPKSNSPPNFFQEMFLSTNGRLGRLQYFKRTLAVMVVLSILISVVTGLFVDNFGKLNSSGKSLIDIAILLSLIPQFCLSVRRIRDIGKFPLASNALFTAGNIKIVAGIYILFWIFASSISGIDRSGILKFSFIPMIILWLWIQFTPAAAEPNKFDND